MNDFDDLDDVFGPLRSAATPAEFASESAVVDAMARNHRHSKGSTMFTSRRTRVAAFVAAGVLGFSGVAAAGHGDSIDMSQLTQLPAEEEPAEEQPAEEQPAEEQPAEEEPAEEEPAEEQPAEEQPAEELPATADAIEVVDEEVDLNDRSTDFDENLCLEGNHGKTVSAAARGDEEFLDDEGVPYTQSQVAQSSCGKDYDVEEIEADDIDDLDIDDVDDDTDDDTDDEDDDEKKKKTTERADKPGRPDHAGSRSNGKKGRG